MPDGVSGTLVSDYFLTEVLLREFAGELGEASREAARTALRRWWRDAGRTLGPVTSLRAVFDTAALPLARILGFHPSSPRGCPGAGVLLADLDGRAGRAASPFPLLLVASWGDNLSSTWRRAVRETLGAGTSWCLSTNGREVRLTDTRHTCSRRHLQFDLAAVADGLPAFAAFWALLRAGAFETPSLVDRIVAASSRQTLGVCRGLRAGVIDAVSGLLGELVPPSRRAGAATGADLTALYGEALTIVYRVLFLLFAESRGMVPTWHPTYRRSYSMEAARALAEAQGPARGLWEALQAMSRLAHAGCRAGTLRVTPFNGRLFAPAATPAGESRRVGDECARRMLLSLTTAPGARGAPRARIVYRDLGVEQLGSVYEAVLDYRPIAGAARPASTAAGAAAPGATVALVSGSGLRKATGTFYTPSSITDFIVRRALSPLVRDLPPERILALRVLDPAMGSGAFLVAACRYLASVYEEALVAGGQYHPSDIGHAERRAFRRLVAQRCLYGVDLNPMAVQLARLSLWLATLAPDRPLTFLDHRLLVGDSLLGASLDDVARRPFPGAKAPPRNRETMLPLFGGDEAGAAMRAVLPSRMRLAAEPDDTVDAVRGKEKLLAALDGPLSPIARWKRIADAWCALAFGLDSGARPPASLFPALADHLAGRHSSLPSALADRWAADARSTAAAHRFFHYPLEFPEAFFDEAGGPRDDGGFDAVLGNPPWDLIPASRLVRFARDSGVYRALSDGHRNLFQLFVERAVRLARRGGRIGLVVPSGLLTDCGCAPLRRLLLERCEVDGLVSFDNAGRIFPIHRSLRFVVFTASTGATTHRLPCRVGERSPAALDAITDPPAAGAFPLVFTRALLERVSGDELSVPDVRGTADLALLEQLVASAPALGARDGWNVRFGRELNATDDKALFSRGGDGLPVVEGKHLQPFRLALPADGARLGPAAVTALGARAATFERARLAYRDVAAATNRLTSIAAIVPAGHATVHTVFCLKTPLDPAEQWFLCGMLNSLVANFLVRLRVTTHVTTAIVARLPVPRPPRHARSFRRIAWLARRLGRSRDPERHRGYALLQAEAARLYGLTTEQLYHVLAGFPLIGEETKGRVRAAWAGLEP